MISVPRNRFGEPMRRSTPSKAVMSGRRSSQPLPPPLPALAARRTLRRGGRQIHAAWPLPYRDAARPGCEPVSHDACGISGTMDTSALAARLWSLQYFDRFACLADRPYDPATPACPSAASGIAAPFQYRNHGGDRRYNDNRGSAGDLQTRRKDR